MALVKKLLETYPVTIIEQTTSLVPPVKEQLPSRTARRSDLRKTGHAGGYCNIRPSQSFLQID
jgi:hypothetical protein